MRVVTAVGRFGASVQDARNRLTIDNPNTVEAVRFMADLYRSGESSEIFTWNQASNNEYLLGGTGSLILNAISAVRTAEEVQLPFVDDLWIWPIPAGPAGRFGPPQTTGVYSIWKFSKHADAAEKFIADLCSGYRQATLASGLFNFPGFPGAFPRKSLYKAAAADPNPAIAETLDTYLIPQMFAQVSQGKLSAADSVRATAKRMSKIWAKWKAAGKI